MAVGFSAITAHFSMTEAMKNEDISSLIPIDYLNLPVIISLGILVYEHFKLIYLTGGRLIFIGH